MSIPSHVQHAVEYHLNAIAEMWKPGAHLTLLVRVDTPDFPGSQDALFTSDELPKVIEAIGFHIAGGMLA